MNRMGMNIATARRGRPKQRPLAPPQSHVTRTEGRVCPVCLKHGRANCKQHSGDKGEARA